MAEVRSIISGVGSYLPERILTNHELSTTVETTDSWIVERTGIKQRYIAAEGEFTSHLATHAAKAALKNAKIDASEIDLIIVATTTPDRTFPSTATLVQKALGIRQGAAFDMQAVCSGFVYALNTADLYIRADKAKKALVIGAETLSRVLDWKDRGTCILFGDGAGAVVLEATEEKKRGILESKLYSDGAMEDLLYVDGGTSRTQTSGFIRMEGREVFKHAVQKMSDVTIEVVEAAGYTLPNVDWFVPHQANMRIMDAIAKRLNVPHEKVVATVDIHANTSAATIPLALDVAVKDGRIKKGDLVALQALGAGFTWGAVLVRW